MKLVSGAGRVLEAAGTVIGCRGGTEEPAYRAQSLTRTVEIRRYDARTAAETTVAAGEQSAREVGFRRLARYIFGANRSRQKIAMTAPVAQQSARENWVIRFFMPADKTLDRLPEPDDGEIRLVTVPPQTIAVRRFTGSAGPDEVARQTDKLAQTLQEFGFEMTDTPAAWFYDPPWTLPPLRRNEIAVPVTPATQNS
ncbi:SOUL family heme-binding protein [Mycobacterium asiaticum]|uniref:Heme-binding protein n=1 Tax=Mycobacterium asiaticum TaxID=1790 RepID=A0A1A3CAF5_MYCAS|nr:heme-binding protein [Mycobacterium asiaticum]OBI84009.1 heme-binding protein [Mycobacterium asiaticum]